MTPLQSGSRLHNWTVQQPAATGDGWREYRVVHSFLGIEADLRVFGSEFSESPETRKTLQRFIQHFAARSHPAIRPVLDTDDASKWTEGSEYVVFPRREGPDLHDTARATPLDTRERILPFLQALAALGIDFQGARFAPDRLALPDLAWDGRALSVHGIAWGVLFDGFLRRRMANLADRWEHDFATGVYPLGEKSYPRVDSIVRLGRLAYEAAGIPNADKKILDTSQVSKAETSASAPPLVAGWGLGVEALVRRCLFAHQPGMIEKPETILEAVERLMAGDTPDVAKALPTVTMASVHARASERQSEPVDKRESTAGLGRGAASSTAVDDEASTSSPDSTHGATRGFTPLGAEAAALDTPAKVAHKKKTHTPPAARAARPAMSDEQKALLLKVGGAVVGVIVVVVVLFLMFSGKAKPNLAPAAAIAPISGTVKTLQALPLDATGSSDPDGDPLTYEWSISGLGNMDYQLEPNGTASASKPTVKFFKRGSYEIDLRVFDGRQYSPPVSVPVTVTE